MDALLNRTRSRQLDDALSGGAAPGAVAAEVALATRLREAGIDTAQAPTEEFRDALRTRLMAVAAVQGIGATAAAPPAPGRSWRQRAAVVGAGAMAAVVATSGVAVAGSRSLPGDPFYGVKRTAEALQLRAADGAHDEGVRHLQFAATRLREVRALVLGRDAARGSVAVAALSVDLRDDVRDAMADMDADTRDGRLLLTAVHRETRDVAPLEELRRFAARQGEQLRALMPALDGDALSLAQGSLVLVDDVRAEADGMLQRVPCTAACEPGSTAPGGSAGGSGSCGCTPAPPAAPAPPGAPAPAPAPGQQAPEGQTPAPAPPSGPTAPPSSGPSGEPPADEPDPQPSLPLPEVPVPTASLPAVDVPGVELDGLLPEQDD